MDEAGFERAFELRLAEVNRIREQKCGVVETPKERARAVISYAHGPHDEHVVELADRLNHDGVDCEIDVYDQEPAEGWARWMNTQMNDRIVLVVCSSDYYCRFRLEEPPGIGLGVTFESGLLIQRVLESQGLNRSVIPVLLRAEDAAYIPEFLRDVTRYDLSQGGYEKLHRRLTQRPVRGKPALGPVRDFSVPTSVPTPQPPPRAVSRQLVLFFAHGIGTCTVGFVEIEHSAQMIKMMLCPNDGEESTFVSRLARSGKSFAVSFGSEAAWVSVKGAKDVLRDRRLVELTLRDETPQGSMMSESSYNGISADDIAGMRARRILLNEKLPAASGGGASKSLSAARPAGVASLA